MLNKILTFEARIWINNIETDKNELEQTKSLSNLEANQEVKKLKKNIFN